MTIKEYNAVINKHTNKINKTKESDRNIKILIKPKEDAYDIHRKLFDLEINIPEADIDIEYKNTLNKPIEVYSNIMYWDQEKDDSAYLVSTDEDTQWMIFLCQIERILNIADDPEYFL